MPDAQWEEVTQSSFAHLSDFRCAKPKESVPGRRAKVATRPWELEVESFLRAVPAAFRSALKGFVASDDHGVVAVGLFQILEGGDSPAFYVLATAVRLDRQGEGLGAALLKKIVDEVTQFGLNSGALEVRLEVAVHKRNRRSLRMVRGQGFLHAPDADEGDYQTWTLLIDLPPLGER